MSLDYDKLNSHMRELRESQDNSFDCTDGDKEVHVSGKSVSNAGISGGWAIILIEPKCRYYGGGMHKVGDGLNTSGGRCNNHRDSGHSCGYSSYDQLYIYNGVDDYQKGT
jgi:hypothetical protein